METNIMSDDNQNKKGISAIYEAAKKLDADLSGMSWNGFNLAGDKKSINELNRLMFQESRLIALEARIQEGFKNGWITKL